ncbi:24917_t:CDS:2, partial [Gigaspora margarita]
SSPLLKDFINLLNFIHANYSTYQLESSLNSLDELMNSTNPVNIMMGISPIYNRIIIDLSHNDDKNNEAFLNVTLPFEQFIFINYEDDSDDNSVASLSLRSTSNSSSSKLKTKRNIELYFLGGEGVATHINGIPEIRCSAGFSAVDNVTRQGYLLTSARCLPNNTQEIYHATWDSPIPRQVPFGVLRESRLNELSPFLSIDGFNLNTLQVPVGHEVCIAGYDLHFTCGEVTVSSARANFRSLRPWTTRDNYYNMIRANIGGHVSNRDIGGTVFSLQYVENQVYIIVEGILTAARYERAHNRSAVTIQPIRRIREMFPPQSAYSTVFPLRIRHAE